MSTNLFVKVESLQGDDGTLYSVNGGLTWYVQYQGEEPRILTITKTPLTLVQAVGLFEGAKDVVIMEIEKAGVKLLQQERLPGEEWKNE